MAKVTHGGALGTNRYFQSYMTANFEIDVLSASVAKITYDNGTVITLTGRNLDMDENGPQGTITGVSFVNGSNQSLGDISQLNISASFLFDQTEKLGGFDGFMKTLLSGNDVEVGSANEDLMNGFDGNDTMDGGKGNDIIYSGAGNDNVKGGDGDDEIYGYDGNDIIDGGRNNDRIDAGAGNDKVKGGDGNDVLMGYDGADTLDGGKGADFLYGGEGKDVMLLGKDKDGDVVHYYFASESGPTRKTMDVIKQFNPKNGDYIFLEAIDANENTPENDEFTWIGSKKFSGEAGELRGEWNKKTGDTIISADLDGDGKADFAIELDHFKGIKVDHFDL